MPPVHHRPPLNRRRFLQTTTAAAALAAGTWGLPTRAGAAPRRWGVGCRDVHLKWVHPTDSWAALRQLGADCFEADLNDRLELTALVAPGRKYSIATPEGIATLRADLRTHRCRISAFCLHNRFDERREQEIALTTQTVRAAERLGVPAVRIDLVPRARKPEAFLPFAIETGRALCAATAQSKVRFGIENHGRVTNDPAFLQTLLTGIGSERMGITLDTANFYWWGHPLDTLYGIYEQFAPRVVHTHCKSIAYPEDRRNARREMGWEYSRYCCPLYAGDIDFARVVAILRRAGYRGDLCVENESLGRFPEAERAGILQKEIAWLRRRV